MTKILRVLLLLALAITALASATPVRAEKPECNGCLDYKAGWHCIPPGQCVGCCKRCKPSVHGGYIDLPDRSCWDDSVATPTALPAATAASRPRSVAPTYTPTATAAPVPTAEPTPSCAQCVAWIVDGPTVHITRWEIRHGKVWADVSDPLTGEPIYDAALVSTDKWVQMLPTSTPTTVSSATATPAPTATPTDEPAPGSPPAEAEVEASPSPSPTLSPSPFPEPTSTPPPAEEKVVFLGAEQFVYDGLARAAHAVFGLPPKGKLCTIRQGKAVDCQETPWWRFWPVTLACLYLAGFVILPRVLSVLLTRLRARIYRSRDQELNLELDRAIHDLQSAGGQQGFVSTDSAVETLSQLRKELQNE